MAACEETLTRHGLPVLPVAQGGRPAVEVVQVEDDWQAMGLQGSGNGLAGNMLASGVDMACRMAERMTAAADTARRAAREHLLLSISMGCLLESLKQRCKRDGVNYTALFNGAKEGAARKKALAAAGGKGFPFTYRTAANYVNVFQDVYSRILSAGQVTEEELGRMLADHAARLILGEAGAGDAAYLWGPYVSADNLRQAYLELAPERPAPTLGERLDEAEATPAPMATWEEQRARICTEFGGFYSQLDSYIAEFARYTTAADRIAQAEQLEEAARRLRAMKTQAEFPALTQAPALTDDNA